MLTTIYQRPQRTREVGGYFELQCVRTKERLTGHGFGEFIQLKDRRGAIWRGEALSSAGATTVTFRSSDGRAMRGLIEGTALLLREGSGDVWCGYVG